MRVNILATQKKQTTTHFVFKLCVQQLGESGITIFPAFGVVHDVVHRVARSILIYD